MISERTKHILLWTVFVVLVVAMVVGAVIGVLFLTGTPCYRGALKATQSHLLALRMASACKNDGRPWPLSNPDKNKSILLDIEHVHEAGTRPAGPSGGWAEFAEYMSGTFGAAMAIAAGVYYLTRNSSAEAGTVLDNIASAGQVEGLNRSVSDRVSGAGKEMDTEMAERTAEAAATNAVADVSTATKQARIEAEANNVFATAAGLPPGTAWTGDPLGVSAEVAENLKEISQNVDRSMDAQAQAANANAAGAEETLKAIEAETQGKSWFRAATDFARGAIEGTGAYYEGMGDGFAGADRAQDEADAESEKLPDIAGGE